MEEKNYYLERAGIYRDGAQNAIELAAAGNLYTATLIFTSIKKASASELKKNTTNKAYHELLLKISESVEDEQELLNELGNIRQSCRNFIATFNKG
ncbi:hypothetical protein KBX31_05205 [Liquorilactobacillus satsumensis]|uniref:hypothetical protein n=1 Tax=Liquorilactobacillus satsumensis TaxID=259059 RepID=UPI0021C2FEAD|nr:hypothetical protein [Liquorilactobacillus satsumensis]MCP9312697.1 hypothetical protein [Liquorilactobacillus satsumensis]MCP9359883.1 hypothetical protein [Liquorilactobacillus satsumensis]